MESHDSLDLQTLRAELGALELRLVDRINTALEKKADQAVLDQVEHRVAALELSRAERLGLPDQVQKHGTRIERLERFRYAIPSTSVLALLGSVGSLLVLLFHH